MATSASSLVARPSEVSSRLRIPATTSGLVANTRATDVANRLVRAMRCRPRAVRVKLGSMSRGWGLLLIQRKAISRERMRRRRHNMRPQVSLGSENWVLAVLTEATSLEEIYFSSTGEVNGATFSATGRACNSRELTKGMGAMVDAGLSSLYTADSIVATCSPISSTRGKNESTTESRIP